LLTCLGDLAMIATLHGNPDAAGLRDEADGAAQEDVFAPDYELAKAWVANLRGDTANALRRAWRTAERATALGGYADAARALHTMVRFGAHGQAFAPLANLARQLQGRVIVAFAAHAAAIDANDSAKLDQVAAAFASLGMMRLAAEAAGTAAALHRRSKRYCAAADAISSAVRYAQQCNGAPIRALLHDDAVATLSARERELTMLAVSGMTNREIAERLVLSVRTVENHMYRTYAKLGIASRNELSCFLWVLNGE
jgi:ATP/maltotriose-dependent transcriptional regulator MalT